MPLLKIQNTGIHSQWALWHILESESDLLSFDLEPAPTEIIHPSKRLEWKAGRILVKELATRTGLVYEGMDKDINGKPYLKNHSHSITLSHSYPYVAAQLSKDITVGIDVEQPKQKLLKIAPRILSADELKDAGDDIIKHCVYWSAKEAMFKIYNKGGLHFKNQLNLAPFQLAKDGQLQGIISGKSGKHDVTLAYEIHPEFVVVFTLTS